MPRPRRGAGRLRIDIDARRSRNLDAKTPPSGRSIRAIAHGRRTDRLLGWFQRRLSPTRAWRRSHLSVFKHFANTHPSAILSTGKKKKNERSAKTSLFWTSWKDRLKTAMCSELGRSLENICPRLAQTTPTRLRGCVARCGSTEPRRTRWPDILPFPRATSDSHPSSAPGLRSRSRVLVPQTANEIPERDPCLRPRTRTRRHLPRPHRSNGRSTRYPTLRSDAARLNSNTSARFALPRSYGMHGPARSPAGAPSFLQ